MLAWDLAMELMRAPTAEVAMEFRGETYRYFKTEEDQEYEDPEKVYFYTNGRQGIRNVRLEWHNGMPILVCNTLPEEYYLEDSSLKD